MLVTLIATAWASLRRAVPTTVALTFSTVAVHEPLKPTHAAVAASFASVATVAGSVRSMESATSTLTAVDSVTSTTIVVADCSADGTVAEMLVWTAAAKSFVEVVERLVESSPTCSWMAKARGG